MKCPPRFYSLVVDIVTQDTLKTSVCRLLPVPVKLPIHHFKDQRGHKTGQNACLPLPCQADRFAPPNLISEITGNSLIYSQHTELRERR